MKLVYHSNPLPITISNYTESSFEYDKWIISDYYREVPIGYEYGFVVTTKEDVSDCSIRTILSVQTSSFVEKLTLLIKYAVGVSLNAPHRQVVHRKFRMIDERETPKGWKSNYEDICSYLNETLPGYVSAIPIPQSAKMPTSALSELKTALEKYDELDEGMKDLISYHNSAVEADERSCYLIFGKVLEMINALYPYKHSHGKDQRINEFFPELLPIFGETTLKDLMGIANSRKETRHYVDKSNIVYKQLTTTEAETYFQRVDVLAMQIIRKALGLDGLVISTNG